MNDKDLIDKNFDLEQEIMRCWNVCDDITDLVEMINRNGSSREEIVKILESFCTVYRMRFERTFSIYEDVCRGLHAIRKERDELAHRIAVSNDGPETVAKKPQGKMAKSGHKKEVDQKTDLV